MLQKSINGFLAYCKTANFSPKSTQSLTTRLNEFNVFISLKGRNKPKAITYKDLIEFVADYQSPSIHIKKARIWSLHQFFHNLKIHNLITENIALKLPYPKMDQTIPVFLTINEFNKILEYFHEKAVDLIGTRNLIIIMMLGYLGLRTSTVLGINTEDVDVENGFVMVKEKGRKRRGVILPSVLCKALKEYFSLFEEIPSPLFVTLKNKRISGRTLQDIFSRPTKKLKINKHLHPHLFRHTAATLLNQISNFEITREVMGHNSINSTRTYVHLNPDKYSLHMEKHPYNQLIGG